MRRYAEASHRLPYLAFASVMDGPPTVDMVLPTGSGRACLSNERSLMVPLDPWGTGTSRQDGTEAGDRIIAVQKEYQDAVIAREIGG
jgi:hypothetical protein